MNLFFFDMSRFIVGVWFVLGIIAGLNLRFHKFQKIDMLMIGIVVYLLICLRKKGEANDA